MRVSLLLGLSTTFVLAAAGAFLITSSVYGDLSHPTLLTAELCLLLLVHLLRYLRLWISRELLMSIGFVGYALLSLAWTENLNVALVTMPAIVNFLLALILFSALAAFHNLRALLAGMSAGFGAAAVLYTLTAGFPFRIPEDFSYNAIAAMYLFGLIITATSGAYAGRTIVPLVFGAILLVLIAATTSIKTNLGSALGIVGASILYFKLSVKSLVRTVLVLAVLGVGIAYGVTSSADLTERVQNGFARVSLGLSALANRENDTGSTGLGTREGWKREGLRGWEASPVFGHGVEAFRADFGITSHSTPIDLLYNSGIIGCGLFYAMLVSIAWRLLRARNVERRNVRARLAAGLIAYSFISLSGIIYYDPFVAIFIGVASGVLMRTERASRAASARFIVSSGDTASGIARP
jgi:O-antigen ligase